MKKSLTALAVIAAVSVPLASAQAMEAKVYGKMHMSIDYVDNKMDAVDASGLDLVHLSTNSSRLGFKGSADLSGGLKGIWKIEGNVKPGDGTGDIGGRNTYLGLAGGFGQIVMGRHDTPVKTISRKTDMFGDQIGDSRNIISSTVSADARPDEVVMYSTPSMSGAQVNVMAMLGDGVTEGSGAGMISASGTYKMGKDLYVGAGYEMMSDKMTGGESQSVIRAGAKYNMGAISIAALFQMSTNEGGVKDMGRMYYGAGASYKMGKTKLKAQYYGVGEYDDVPDTGGGLIAVGADQKLGDMTTAYVAFAMGMNGDASSYVVTRGGHDSGKDTAGPPDAGEGPMALSLGVVHKF